MRATGAQGLARRGLDPWSIQLLGRWGSDAVRGYIREAQFESAARSAAAPSPKQWTLEELVEYLKPLLKTNLSQAEVGPQLQQDSQAK